MSLIQRLHLKRTPEGNLKGRPFWGAIVEVAKVGKAWEVDCVVDGVVRSLPDFPTRKKALSAICAIGREEVMTCNLLNPKAGEFAISRMDKGGCCDPGTETYHCM